MAEQRDPAEEVKERFKQTVRDVEDPVLVVLRAHLLTEHYLERIVETQLARPDRIFERGRLNYHQKLALVDSLDILSDSTVSSLRQLNRFRNSLAHDLDKRIEEIDVRRIGSPLGSTYRSLKGRLDHTGTLRNLLAYLCGVLGGIAVRLEEGPDQGDD